MTESPESLSLSQQQYVEAIASLVRDKGRARTTDVARILGVRLPSVTEAVRRLNSLGLTLRRSRFEIALTPRGWRIAEQLDGRQAALRRFMVEILAMPPELADEVACRVEHCVDRGFADRLAALADYMATRDPAARRKAADYIAARVAVRER